MNSARHQPRKRFGQNFLHDAQVIARIVAAIDARPGQRLVEIGPGQGALTLPLLRAIGDLDVVELDRDLIAPLAERCGPVGTLRIHAADALRFDFHSIAAGDLRVVGNLPYNISTPLLFHLIAQIDCIRDMTFTLQKEVVERLAASPGGGDYGRLSVMVQYHCAVTPLFGIGADAFRPAPKVESACVRLTPHATPPVDMADMKLFADVVRLAFGQRRKTLRNALKTLMDEDAWRRAGVDPQERAERLSLAQFAAIVNALAPAPGTTGPARD
jgi:16S rRNA (adenine1518-N6/adenine1519-N6)-dimethyltransferase